MASAAAAVVAGSKNELLVGIGTRAAPFGGALLVVGVLVGAWIRRRQWRRACMENENEDEDEQLMLGNEWSSWDSE